MLGNGKRLLTIAATAGLMGGTAWMAVPAASAAPIGGAAPLLCLHGQEGTFAENGSPIYTTASLTTLAGTANAGDTFNVTQINPGNPAKYLGTDLRNGVHGWAVSTEMVGHSIHCIPA
jgi:hypothetical protein